MERTQLFDLMGELKLYGMKAAFDEIMATAVKRQHEPQRIVGDLLNPARESASNRCVFVVSSLAGIVLKLPRVSYPAKASAATRDAKCLGAGRERPQGLSRPFSSRRMSSVSAGF